jgi:hypothetical protein
MKKIIIAIIFLSFSYIGFSQQVAKPLEPISPVETIDNSTPNIDGVVSIYDVLPTVVSNKCTAFFKSLMTEAANKAYNDLLDGSPIKINDDKVKNQVIKTVEAIELYGKIEGYELIGSDEISTSYLKVKYLSLHAYNPLLWTFTFYNSPKNGWIVLNMKLTDEL